jgi:hypothetical protein
LRGLDTTTVCTKERKQMIKKLLLIAFFAAFASVTTTETLTKFMGFGPGTVQAAEDDDAQGDNDNQGEDGDPQ